MARVLPPDQTEGGGKVRQGPRGIWVIEFENVSKSFWTGKTRKVILDRATFRVELGNSLGILAPNGTGKTTIINMMAGLEQPDEGKITRSSRISFPLGFMGGVVSRHSATENARYIARLYSLDPDYVESFCRWLCGIGEYFDMPVGTYSSGMRARFSFALLLALEFDIYLIDESMPAAIGELGQRWYDVTVTGMEAHAGPTPMNLRRDALLPATRLIQQASCPAPLTISICE